MLRTWSSGSYVPGVVHNYVPGVVELRTWSSGKLRTWSSGKFCTGSSKVVTNSLANLGACSARPCSRHRRKDFGRAVALSAVLLAVALGTFKLAASPFTARGRALACGGGVAWPQPLLPRLACTCRAVPHVAQVFG